MRFFINTVWLFIALNSFSQNSDSSQRRLLQEAITAHPNNPWPRGEGHIVLAIPGATEDFKAYLEPGGSFSPAFASFGVSIWIGDTTGKRLAISDSIPLNELSQKFVWKAGGTIPAVRTETKFYTATWSSGGHGKWKLEFEPKTEEEQRVVLMIRSVGPAGGPITSLGWENKPLRQRLAINDRWVVTFNRMLSQFDVAAPDGAAHLTATGFRPVNWQPEEEWGYAGFNLPNGKSTEITITDFEADAAPQLKFSRVAAPLKFKIPDPTFIDALQAQVAHLMMGLVGNETRPGEPNNYPLNWLRDGAYVIVALARAGQLEIAQQLIQPFAEHDFFGGFGAEADAPGLALWAMEEVAGLSNDRKLDNFLWPHVLRKTALISEMLAATNSVRKSYHGPIVPSHQRRGDLDLVCDAAKEGLVQGKMDWHRPVLYVNAVAYRGLLNAAILAERLGHADTAQEWRGKAVALRNAWNRAFVADKYANERNYICALYPSFVASDLPIFEQRLEKFWNSTHDETGTLAGTPLWTYFNLAQAHQWLVLGQPQKTWSDVRWFWEHQASPGLYTWWEGKGEENNFGRWEKMIRGWSQPRHVTPHYWTAAEMLLLQLEMLAFVDETREPLLVVGAGVPATWLEKPLEVAGIGTRFGKVDWEYRAGRLTVVQHGFRLPVKLGPEFPADTVIRIRKS